LKRLVIMRRNALLALLSLAFSFSACGSNPTPVVVPTGTLGQQTQLPPTPTLTPEPPKILNICIAEDPGSLFRYEGRDSLAKQSVFQHCMNQTSCLKICQLILTARQSNWRWM